MKVDILDYGVGNIGSIIRMIEKVGGSAKPINKPDEIRQSNRLILPGVGHFDHGMSQLFQRDILEPLQERVIQHGTPILGICLGMQLMCNSSEEGILPGLGWVNASVEKFRIGRDSVLKIPHMGWKEIDIVKENPIITSDPQQPQRFYFVHSYHVSCHQPSDVLAVTNHGHEFTAAFSHENIIGVQFHPEKSHKFGMILLKKFLEM